MHYSIYRVNGVTKKLGNLSICVGSIKILNDFGYLFSNKMNNYIITPLF